jgi:alpha-tubulin suppressor-like RCC1 family protein
MAESHTCGISASGTLWCWGENARGELGDGTHTQYSDPVEVDAERDWDRVTLGRAHSCALRTDHSLWCWGANANGEIGDGTAWSGELQPVE